MNTPTEVLLSGVSGDDTQGRVLLDAAANVNAKTELGRMTPKWAAGKMHAGTVALMLGRGADVNAKMWWGDTVMMSARDNVKPLLLAAELAHSLDDALPPATVPGPSAHVPLANGPMIRAVREGLGAPDPRQVKPSRPRL